MATPATVLYTSTLAPCLPETASQPRTDVVLVAVVSDALIFKLSVRRPCRASPHCFAVCVRAKGLQRFQAYILSDDQMKARRSSTCRKVI